MNIISRAEAKQLGLKRYFTGKPCKHGHIAERYTVDSKCLTCVKESNVNRRELDNKFKRDYYKSEKGKAARKKYSEENSDKIRQTKRNNYQRNIERERQRRRDDYSKHKEKRKQYNAEYRKKNRSKLNKYYRERRINDTEFKINTYMRNMIGRIVNRGYDKTKPTCEILGYDTKDLMCHIESQFIDDMSWSNYGDWHIDHIIPVVKWLEVGVDDPKVINALDNLQPLWAKDNLSKGSKIQ